MKETIIIILLIAVIVLLAIVLLSLSKKKDNNGNDAVTGEKIDNLYKFTANAFSDIKRDYDTKSEAVRNAVVTSVDKMAGKTDNMNTQFTNQTVALIKSISDMREKIDTSSHEQTKAVTLAVEKLQRSNEEKRDKMRETVDEKLTTTLSSRLDSTFKTVSEQLQNVYKSLGEMKELSDGVTSLNRIFTNVKTRGNWAETQLEGILDRIIPGMYIKNYSPLKNKEVVEFAVIIPDSSGGNNTYLPIDSKFPVEDYLRLCEAADNGDIEGVKAARKKLEARVLAEAKDVSKYIVPPETTPFAVLYLATDSLYAEVLASKENIADRLHDEYNILLAGPSTITALLSSLAMGFRTLALNQKANEVMDLLAAAKTQYDKFGAALEKAKKKIDEAGKSLDEAQHRNDIIVKKLKGVETVDTADDILLTD